MIKYNLVCKKCNKFFDSWFSSSKEYEKLKKLKHINCYNCNSLEVEKSLMSPNIINSKNKKLQEKNKQFDYVKKTLKEYQKFIKDNFKYVGKNFAYEARSIHYKNKKNSKGIYGEATKEDLKELKEEGIETEMIPWVKNNTN